MNPRKSNKLHKIIISLFIIIIIGYKFFAFSGVYKKNSNIIKNWILTTWQIVWVEHFNVENDEHYFYQIKYVCKDKELTQRSVSMLWYYNKYSSWDEIKLYCLESNPSAFVMDDWIFQKNIFSAFFEYSHESDYFVSKTVIYSIAALFVLYILFSLFTPKLFKKNDVL